MPIFRKEADYNAILALKAPEVCKQIITVMIRVSDDRGLYIHLWVQE